MSIDKEIEQLGLVVDEDVPAGFRAGFVALVGRPNVGKSTLLNALLGEKVAIVTPKPQTTRTRIHGILNRPDAQIVFVDTPGVCDNRTPLRSAMRRIAGTAAADSDVALVVVEPRGQNPEVSAEDREVVQAARDGASRIIVALNKVDRIANKAALLPWMQRYTEELDLEAIVPISALKRDGLDHLLAQLLERVPESVPLFPRDLHTDRAERFLCEELVREQVLMQTQQEVPHSAAVVIESFEDLRREDPKDPGLCRLEGRIIIERDSQKGIVVGKGGARIKSISQAARQNIEELLGSKVYLRLTVHVDSEWTRREAGLRRYGLDGMS